MKSYIEQRRWFQTIILTGGLLPAILSGWACDAGLPAAGLVPDQNTAIVEPNFDPNDPLIAVVKGLAGEATLFGSKDADGAPQTLESARLLTPDGDAYHINFDELERPTQMLLPDGSIIAFSYTDTHLALKYYAPSGEVSTATIPFSEIPDWPASAIKSKNSDDAADADREKAYADDDFFGSRRVVDIVTSVRTVYNDQDTGPLKGAFVLVTVDYKDGTPLRTYTTDFHTAGDYANNFITSHIHEFADTNLPGKEACDSLTGAADKLNVFLTRVGVPLAAAGLICKLGLIPSGGALAPVCLALDAVRAAWLGMGMAVAGLGTSELTHLLDCSKFVIKKNPGNATIEAQVWPTDQRLGVKKTSKIVDLDGLAPPHLVVLSTVFYDVDVRILNADLVPLAPAGGQSYQISFTVSPPGSTVAWTLTGDDNFSTSGEATAPAGSNAAVTTSIPGGIKGVTDSFNAQIKLSGSLVGPVYSNHFMFQ